jgi:hypothetical protein
MSALSAPVKRRFASILLMCESLVRHRAVLTEAIHAPEFSRLAGASRSGGYIDAEGLDEDDIQEIHDMDADGFVDLPIAPMSAAIRSSPKYSIAFTAVSSASFWRMVQEYINFE